MSKDESLQTRLDELEAAIIYAVTQKLDDVCWMDVYKNLAALVGIEFKPETLPREQMLANCARFVDSLLTGAQYNTIPTGSFAWALEQMKAGKRVRHPRMPLGLLYLDGSLFTMTDPEEHGDNEMFDYLWTLTIPDFEATDWQLGE